MRVILVLFQINTIHVGYRLSKSYTVYDRLLKETSEQSSVVVMTIYLFKYYQYRQSKGPNSFTRLIINIQISVSWENSRAPPVHTKGFTKLPQEQFTIYSSPRSHIGYTFITKVQREANSLFVYNLCFFS
mgnify:CR=1 FL=1